MTQILELTTDVKLQIDDSRLTEFLEETKGKLLKLKSLFDNLPNIGGFLKDLQTLSKRFSKITKTGAELPKIMEALTQSTADSARTFKNLKNDIPDLSDMVKNYKSVAKASQAVLKANRNINKSLQEIGQNQESLKQLSNSFRGLKNDIPNLASISKNYKDAARASKQVVAGNKNIQNSIINIIKEYGGWAIAIGGLKKSISAFAGFQDILLQTQATLGGTNRDFRTLQKTAKLLGETTRFTGQEVAVAQLSLVRAGVAAKNTMYALKPLINLATVSGESVSTLTDQVMRAVSGFGLAESDIAGLADVMFRTASTVSMSVGNMGAAFQRSAGMAKLAGLDYKQTAKYIALMASVSVGEEAGTALTSSIQKLSAPSREVKDALRSIGIVGGNVGSQLEQLRTRLKNLDKDMQLKIGSQIFGEHAKSMLAILTATDAEFERISKSVDSAGGSLDKAKKIMDKGLMGSLMSLGSLVGGLAINFGQFLAPAVYLLVQAIKLVIMPLNKILGLLNSGTWVANIFKNTLLILAAAVAWNIISFKALNWEWVKSIRNISLFQVRLWGSIITVGAFKGALLTLKTGLISLGVAFKALPGVLWQFALALKTATVAVWKFIIASLKLIPVLWKLASAKLILLPFFLKVIIIMAALVAIGWLLYKNWDFIRKKSLELWEAIKNLWGILDNNPLGKILKFWLMWLNPIGLVINSVKELYGIWEKFKNGKDIKLKQTSEKISKESKEFKNQGSNGWVYEEAYGKSQSVVNNTTESSSYSEIRSKQATTNYNFYTNVADNQEAEGRQRDNIKLARDRSKYGIKK